MDFAEALEIALCSTPAGDAESLNLRRQALHRVIEGASAKTVAVIEVSDLIRCLGDADDEVRHGMAILASRVKQPAAKAVKPALVTLLGDRNQSIRLQAVQALLLTKQAETDAIWPILFELTKADDQNIRSAASVLLSEILSGGNGASRLRGLVKFETPPGTDIVLKVATLDIEPPLKKRNKFKSKSNRVIVVPQNKGQGGPVADVEQPGEDAQFKEVMRSATERTHELRQTLAVELAPVLNARIRSMPHETLEQKKELARWVNDHVEPIGLAILEPKTGLPGKLRGQTGHWPGVGRFVIEVIVDGKQKTPTVSDTLPELTLTDATPQRQPMKDQSEVDWQETVGPRESRHGRKIT